MRNVFCVGGGVTLLVLAVIACSSSSTGGGGGGSSGTSGAGSKPKGFSACHEAYFAKILSSCSSDSDCGGLSCDYPASCPTCSDRCRGKACSTNADCASYASLCEPDPANAYYFGCFKANSLDDGQCNIFAGSEPPPPTTGPTPPPPPPPPPSPTGTGTGP